MSTRSRVVSVVAVLVLVAAGVIAWSLLHETDSEEALTLYGNVEIREVALGFDIPGRLASMRYHEGDEVGAGDRLAALDPESYEESMAAAEARVRQAAAGLDRLDRGSRPQEIEQAAARLRDAEAALRTARRNHERQLELLESGITSQQQVDAAWEARESAEARLADAREDLDLVREGFRDEEVAAARAELAAAEAELESARTRLAETVLRAPSDGVVLTRVHEPGAVVGAGVPVYILSLPEPVWIRAYAAEPDLGEVVPGATVWVTTDSSPLRYQGQVGFVSPRAEFTPRTVQTEDLRTALVYRVRIVVIEPDDRLRQGMPVTVHVPPGQHGVDDETLSRREG